MRIAATGLSSAAICSAAADPAESDRWLSDANHSLIVFDGPRIHGAVAWFCEALDLHALRNRRRR